MRRQDDETRTDMKRKSSIDGVDYSFEDGRNHEKCIDVRVRILEWKERESTRIISPRRFNPDLFTCVFTWMILSIDIRSF